LEINTYSASGFPGLKDLFVSVFVVALNIAAIAADFVDDVRSFHFEGGHLPLTFCALVVHLCFFEI
jgi:hypothetical protein